MKRYDLEQSRGYESYGIMEEAADYGDWVKYEEANAEIESLRARMGEAEREAQRGRDAFWAMEQSYLGASARAERAEAELGVARGLLWYTASTTWEQQAKHNYAQLRDARDSLRRIAEWEDHYPTDPDKDTDAMRAVARAALGDGG